MKTRQHRTWITVSLIFLAGLLGYSIHHYSSLFTPLPHAQIALVNLTSVRNQAQAFLAFKEIIEHQYQEFHEEILTEETRLKKAFEVLKVQERKKSIASEQLKEQKEKLDADVKNLEKAVNDKKQYLNEIFAQITHELETRLHKVIKKIAHKKHFDIILNATILDAPVILYGSESLDITSLVVARLNRDLPTIDVPEPLPSIAVS